ncbi:Double-stranded RNA-binding protein 4 [Sesamum alatum]|uniref:Double-stranded RNA-binding protein 4 n=1 Tax=Sesamum alatum TaxID=300844 RepID=A0AAE2CA88_9LAMI|nr:Double-stranded RNA-binding protein 4 [Sesamum alatum]
MYKSKLQELCHRRSWELPEYTTVKDGPDHMPHFTATVNVHGEVFQTPSQCRSAKEAQNTAARIAFDHFNVPSSPRLHRPPPSSSALPRVDLQFNDVSVPAVPPSPEMQPVAGDLPVLPLSPLPSALPIPPPGLLAIRKDSNSKPAVEQVLQQNCEDTTDTSMVHRRAIGSHDTLHMCKNLLQQYAQKHNLGFPVYTSEAEGPPHARRFKSRVCLEGKSYETFEFFPTLKEAEQAAAKVACQVLSVDVVQEDGGLYKNLLQEFAQKKGLLCPSYDTVSSGLTHRPVFVSTVEIGSDTFRGAEAKTKKLAEMNAAKVAYYALTRGCPASESSKVSSVNECVVANIAPQNTQPVPMNKKHQDATDEEAQIDAKRAKSSPDNVNVNARVPGPPHSTSPSNDTDSLSSQVENSTSTEPVTKQPVENQPLHHLKTVVWPRNSSSPPVPEHASVKPYSDDKWIAYRVEPDK